MQTLGEDVLLLAIQQNGTIAAADKMHFALAGSELIRLAALRRVDVVAGRIVVIDPAATGDALLDDAFASMGSAKRPARAKDWVARRQSTVTRDYLERLTASGAVRCEVHKTLGLFRVRKWFVADAARARTLKSQLDNIAFSSGTVNPSQTALGGLVHAVGLSTVLYPGAAGHLARKRLTEIAGRNEAVRALRGALADAEANQATINAAATRAATDAAIDASFDAATQAAIQASIDASIGASVDAASSASAHPTHHAHHNATMDSAHHAHHHTAMDSAHHSFTGGGGMDGGGHHHHG